MEKKLVKVDIDMVTKGGVLKAGEELSLPDLTIKALKEAGVEVTYIEKPIEEEIIKNITVKKKGKK